MIKFQSLKTKNPVLKVIYSLINIVMALLVGILNLIISFGKWIYHKLIKTYKYEFLYITIISAICIYFSILGIIEYQKTGREITACFLIPFFPFPWEVSFYLSYGLPVSPQES